MIDQKQIRNFCIIAHIDHGKSTLADRLLELTGTIPKEKMKEQYLDQMELERERGITIKLAPVRMHYGQFILNLIDTPGHVDFSYEVSRSLAACEGAILLIDATKGIQAQTLTNAHLAQEQGLIIIPVVNKIDLPHAQISETIQSLINTFGFKKEEIILASAKTGKGVDLILKAIIEKIPSPKGNPAGPLRALIFDSLYDPFHGVIAYVRIVDGQIKKGEKIVFLATGKESETQEVGIFKPQLTATKELFAGEIGYIITGLKKVKDCRVGDTITNQIFPTSISEKGRTKIEPLPGYKQIKPMVYVSFFTASGENYNLLREALEKLQLNDASLIFEPERSPALGFGFRCGFLGLLHMEIIKERLEREYNLDLIAINPSVPYQIEKINKEIEIIRNPAELPNPNYYTKILEPIVNLEIITPKQYLGPIMELANKNRGVWIDTKYLDENRVLLIYQIPLSEIIVDFYDKLKSISAGFASMNYEFLEYREGDLVKIDILIGGKKIDAFSRIVPKNEANFQGREMVEKLRKLIPRQLFEVRIQAAIGSRIIASISLPPLKKDVTAKLYGGDVTRKRKLLEKQKAGKKRLKRLGKVDIPHEAFLAFLKKI